MSDLAQTSLPPLGRASCPYCHGQALSGPDWRYRRSAIDGTADDAIGKLSARGCNACGIIAAGLLAIYPAASRSGTQGVLGYISVSETKPGTFEVEAVLNSGHPLVTRTMRLEIYSLHGNTGFFLNPLTPKPSHDSSPIKDLKVCDVAVKPGHLNMWDFLLECYQDCLKTHTFCTHRQEQTWVPKRLIAIHMRDGAIFTRLIDTTEVAFDGPYLALSYCWGGRLPLRTLSCNILRHKRDIPLQRYPACFQDCINTALNFGIDHIWIDSLCIVQNDIQDWATQAPTMDRVFANARITIRAVESENSEVSFLGKSAPSSRVDFQSVRLVGEGIDPDRQVYARRSTASAFDLLDDTESTPLANRGWAWQERVLSTRTITFYKAAAVWRCKSLVKSECGRTCRNLTPEVGFLRTRYERKQTYLSQFSLTFALALSHGGWRWVVGAYSPCSITYHLDKLPALSGTAARFQSVLGDRYVAGIWQNDLIRGLDWCRGWHCLPSKPRTRLSNNSPSWSWASVDGLVQYPIQVLRILEGPWVASASVQEIDCHPISASNVYGEVRQGSSITISAPVIQAKMEIDDWGNAVLSIGTSALLPVYLDSKPEASPPILPGHGSETSAPGCGAWCSVRDANGIAEAAVTCAKIFSETIHKFSALILIKSTHHEDGYQRIGYLHSEAFKSMCHKNAPWSNVRDLGRNGAEYDYFAEAETRTIKIY